MERLAGERLDVAEHPGDGGVVVVGRGSSSNVFGSGLASMSDFLDPAVALDRRAVEGHALFEGDLELGRRDLDRLQEAEDVGEPQPDEADPALLDGAQDVLELALHTGSVRSVCEPAAGRTGPVTQRSHSGNGREIGRPEHSCAVTPGTIDDRADTDRRHSWRSAVAYKAEYIWIDGTEPTARLRSKTKILGGRTPTSRSGASTVRARTRRRAATPTACCKPVFSCPDPIRGGDNMLVMCEVLLPDMTPHPTNTRALLAPVAEKYAEQEPLFGIEQEYTFFKDGRPHGFPDGGGFPAPQGFYYCGVGADEVYGRDVVEAHLDACLEAGLGISGINAEVMPGQWEFQVGPLSPLDVSDQLWMARWLLYRIAEDFGIAATLDPKPVKGDWNGAGAHTNFSTKAMRESYDPIITACEALGKRRRRARRALRRRHRAPAHRSARDRAVERVQLRRLRPRRVGAHPVAGRGRQEGLHRGPSPERQHGPVRRDAPHHRDGAAAASSEQDARARKHRRRRAPRTARRPLASPLARATHQRRYSWKNARPATF